MTQAIELELIRTDGGTQPRTDLCEATAAEYAASLEAGASFPPVVVFGSEAEGYWLADGFHRVAAHRLAGRSSVEADVRPGGRREALLHAVGANAEHGLRRSASDKRRAVELLLADAEWAAWSDREIGRACKVSHPFVAKVRAASGNVTSERRVERCGVTYTMRTSDIGVATARASLSALADRAIPLELAPMWGEATRQTGEGPERWWVGIAESRRSPGYYRIEIIHSGGPPNEEDAWGEQVWSRRAMRPEGLRYVLALEGVPAAVEWFSAPLERVAGLFHTLDDSPAPRAALQ